MTKLLSCSESELVTLIKQNDKNVFEYLYHNYSAALSYVIGKLITDKQTAEDLLQESFINIWSNIHQYDAAKGKLYTWMRNVTTNKCLDFLRSSVHNMRKRVSGNEMNVSGEILKTEQKTDHIGISQIINNLNSDHQKVIRMAYYYGNTFEEISCQLNLPLGTVKSRMRRAIGIIRSDFAYAV